MVAFAQGDGSCLANTRTMHLLPKAKCGRSVIAGGAFVVLPRYQPQFGMDSSGDSRGAR